ncbi:MAG: hypothetical protein LUD44_01940 [Firmicutes bacterium]|nr:hypothetical protein [Bacillota bacterium]
MEVSERRKSVVELSVRKDTEADGLCGDSGCRNTHRLYFFPDWRLKMRALRMAKKRKKERDHVFARQPNNYMSDLFIVAMVLSWIIVIFIMVVMAMLERIRIS